VASTIKWATPGTFTDLLTTELNALANAAGAVLSPAFDNRANLFLFGDFVLNSGFSPNPTAGNTVDLYLIPATDGTNYTDGGAATRPASAYRGSWVMRSASPLVLALQGISLPPCPFKITVLNNSGAAMGATGNKVSISPYNYQSV